MDDARLANEMTLASIGWRLDDIVDHLPQLKTGGR